MKYPPVQYQDYLKIEQLLSAQRLRSAEFKNPAHDEMLFIIVHQVYELWFKQIIFELESVQQIFSQAQIPEAQMGLAVSRLQRVVSIQKYIHGQIDVLETMTPLDFLEFRDYLYPASGFQSFQWRKIETLLGLKMDSRLKYNDSPFYKSLDPSLQQEMHNLLQQPSLFDLVDRWLARTPYLSFENFDFWTEYQRSVIKMFAEDKEVVHSNPRLSEAEKKRTLEVIESSFETFKNLFSETEYKKLQDSGSIRLSFKALHAALLIQIYRDQPVFQQPFKLLSCLLDIDENMTQWRYRHALMAHRMLGKKIGTGGSSGHDYLKEATEKHKIFTDFFNLTTFLVPRSKIPHLPKELEQRMGYLPF